MWIRWREHLDDNWAKAAGIPAKVTIANIAKRHLIKEVINVTSYPVPGPLLSRSLAPGQGECAPSRWLETVAALVCERTVLWSSGLRRRISHS